VNNIKIIVSSPSFSKNPLLREELLALFPHSVFNESGKRLKESELIPYFEDADGAIIGLEPITAHLMDSLKKIKIFSKFGVGLDNVDVDHAARSSKKIGWVGGVNKRSVSEMALCFMLGLNRNIFQCSYDLKNGKWNKNGGYQLTNKTIGIIGCGNIGEDILRLLQPFDCELLICDILDKTSVCKKYGVSQVSFDQLLVDSDIVSLHVPLTNLTREFINKKNLNMMKKESYLINTSRGPVVNETDLKGALINRQIAGAALDVFVNEPPSDNEFLSLPNLVVTPHTGGNASEAVLAMGRSAINNLKKYFL